MTVLLCVWVCLYAHAPNFHRPAFTSHSQMFTCVELPPSSNELWLDRHECACVFVSWPTACAFVRMVYTHVYVCMGLCVCVCVKWEDWWSCWDHLGEQWPFYSRGTFDWTVSLKSYAHTHTYARTHSFAKSLGVSSLGSVFTPGRHVCVCVCVCKCVFLEWV